MHSDMMHWQAIWLLVLPLLMSVLSASDKKDPRYHTPPVRESSAPTGENGGFRITNRRSLRADPNQPNPRTEILFILLYLTGVDGGAWFLPFRNRMAENSVGHASSSPLGATPPSKEKDGEGSHSMFDQDLRNISPIHLPPAKDDGSPRPSSPPPAAAGPVRRWNQLNAPRSLPNVETSGKLSPPTPPPSLSNPSVFPSVNMVRVVRSNPGVSTVSSQTSEELRAYYEATRLRRTRAYFNVEALVAAQKSGSSSDDDDDELSESDQSETSEGMD